MNRRLHDAVEQASESRAFFVLMVVLSLRAWRTIPHLRPIHLLVPLSISQIVLFIVTAFDPRTFLFMFFAGNIVIAWFAILPLSFERPVKAHWVR